MAPLDWVVLGVLALSLLLGLWRGLVYEVLSLAGWVVAFVAAQWFASDVAQWLPMGSAGEGLRYAAGFVLVFIGTLFAWGLLAWGAKKLIEAVGLRPVDRVLGGMFGLARGVLLVLVLAVVVHITALRSQPWWAESATAGVSAAALRGLKPVLPESFGRHLPDERGV